MSKRLLKTLVAVLAIAAAATGPAGAQSNSEQLFYTLDGTQTDGSANYYQSSEITQGGISWWVTGNTTMNPWRIGGNNLNGDRDIYGEGSLDETVTKVSFDFGTNNGVTVNSITMFVASDANFADIIEQKTVSYSANSTVDVTPGAGFEWTNAYYMFTFNVTVSGSSNKYFQLNAIRFYYDPNAGSATSEPEPTTWQTETLLTTITATGTEQASYSTANVATVSFSNLPSTTTNTYGSAYLANWGWYGYGFTATVTPAEGYTITKCIFYDDADRTATDSEAPFVVETTEEDKTPRINGTPIDGGNMWSKGIKKIEVYGYETPAVPHTVRFASGNDGWTVTDVTASASATAPAILQNVMAGDSLVVTAPASLTGKVKSVKAVKYVAPTITVDGLVLNGQDGDSWETLVANNPGKIGISGGFVSRLSDGANLVDGECGGGSTTPVSSSTTYNASWADEYHFCGD